jgi:two-component system cell cycle response regulator
VGRYGGEEFLLVLPGCDFISAFRRADQIRESVADEPVAAAATLRRVTLSMGIAVADGLSVPNARFLLHQADLGLYKAKKNGRNRVEQVNRHEVPMADSKELSVEHA